MATGALPAVTRSVIEERIGQLRFANPARHNALGAEVLGALMESLATFSAQGLPVVILTGGIGQAVWSARFDINEMVSDRDPLAHGKPLERLLHQVRSYPGVVIAMVSGSVWGGAAERAAHFGVVNQLVEAASLEDATRQVARLVSGKGPMAVRAIKEQLRILEDCPPMPVDAMERIAELRRQACEGAEFTEGLQAFLARRPPEFGSACKPGP